MATSVRCMFEKKSIKGCFVRLCHCRIVRQDVEFPLMMAHGLLFMESLMVPPEEEDFGYDPSPAQTLCLIRSDHAAETNHADATCGSSSGSACSSCGSKDSHSSTTCSSSPKHFEDLLRDLNARSAGCAIAPTTIWLVSGHCEYT